MSYTPIPATIFEICISQCYKIGNVPVWKSVVIPLCPPFRPRFYLSESQTSPQPFHHSKYIFFFQDLHILSYFWSNLRNFLRCQYWCTPPIFSFDLPLLRVPLPWPLQLVSSHPTIMFVLYLFHQLHVLLPLSKGTLTIDYPKPDFYPQLTMYLSNMFFWPRIIFYPSVRQ